MNIDWVKAYGREMVKEWMGMGMGMGEMRMKTRKANQDEYRNKIIMITVNN